MRSYRTYVEQAEKFVTGIIEGEVDTWKKDALALLDGQPSRELRRAVDLTTLRQTGAFFTPRRMAQVAIDVRPFGDLNPKELLAIDPACGAGDLLLRIAQNLEVKPTLSETLKLWGTQLIGFDQSSDFVRLTKLRLTLLALHRGAIATHGRSPDLARIFPHIRIGNALAAAREIRRADLIVLNPPFFLTDAFANCKWASGRITAAASFTEHILLSARYGARIIAILPEVLRTGTRYVKWRQLIEKSAHLDSVRPLGLFDSATDVHVFILVMTKTAAPSGGAVRWWTYKSKKSTRRVGELFDVHVGAVVPHRDRKAGPIYRYIHARSVPSWGRVDRIKETRRFNGTTFSTPFVAVRRTSRPEDSFRAVGSLIAEPGEIAVENHLIICKPKNGTLKSCYELLRVLKSKKTNAFLNGRIRCRHLTVSAIREIPLG